MTLTTNHPLTTSSRNGKAASRIGQEDQVDQIGPKLTLPNTQYVYMINMDPNLDGPDCVSPGLEGHNTIRSCDPSDLSLTTETK